MPERSGRRFEKSLLLWFLDGGRLRGGCLTESVDSRVFFLYERAEEERSAEKTSSS